ncbi:MAG: hypothetical protein HY901_36340 [Deltaproteobacteria bacterium]|nr:hypothetical protein [Deltaproteobacteria bacterium]
MRIPRALAWGKRKLKKTTGGKGPLAKVAGPLPKLVGALKKEAAIGPVMHQEALGALKRMQAKDPSLTKELQKAHGYAVFPGVGKATLLLGGAFGRGEVFEKGRVIGYAGIVQMTLGVQVGGQTFNELVLFDSREALDAFKHSKVAFAANASAVLVKAGAAASSSGTGKRIFVHSEGGMMLEAAIGGQKFIFKPAALGRLRSADVAKAGASEASKLGVPSTPSVH